MGFNTDSKAWWRECADSILVSSGVLLSAGSSNTTNAALTFEVVASSASASSNSAIIFGDDVSVTASGDLTLRGNLESSGEFFYQPFQSSVSPQHQLTAQPEIF